MADPEHLEILGRGVTEWNSWREGHPTIWPNLLGAALPRKQLDHANLENANLLRANLDNASLVEAKLRNCNLRDASLMNANLTGADLQEANLYGAKLSGATLNRAMLRHANLLRAVFDRTSFAFATFGYTSFDHGLIEGAAKLGTIYHDEPSIVDSEVFEATARLLRRKPFLTRTLSWFLEDAGIPELMLKSLRKPPKPKRCYSCFVGYSHREPDKEFVKSLCKRLKAAQVPYWRDDRGLSYGSILEDEIASAINHYDRTLVCCSESSLNSEWVNKEISMIMSREDQIHRAVLLPLDIDGCLLDNPASQRRFDFSSRLIADFKGWRDERKFTEAFKRLLDALNPRTA